MRKHCESADGHRVMKSNVSSPSALNTLYWYGTGSDAVMETDLSNNMRYNYFFFGRQRVGRSDISNSITRYFGDISAVPAGCPGRIPREDFRVPLDKIEGVVKQHFSPALR